MATPENLHKNIPNSQLHDPKDFSTAGVGTSLRKGMDSNLEWAVPYWQDSVLDRVDMALTPPSENDGDRYIIINLTSTVVHADWDGASENDIVEFDLDASAWVSVTPFFDMTARSQADLNQYYFDGTTWNDVIGSSGDVSQSGTSSDNQIAVFTADKTIEGNSDFTFDSTLNTFNINQFGTGSLNVSLGIAKMQMDSNPSTWQSYTHDSTTNTSLLELIRSRGTAASPSAVQSGDALGIANFKGYNTSSYIVGGLMEFNATETWSGSAQGTEFKVQTILTGATSLADRIVVDGSGDITLGNYKFDGDQTVGSGQDNYVLTYDYATGLISLEAAASGGLSDIVDDATPQLGGSLDVNGNKIVSVSNGNIDIEPNGTGNVLLGNFTFDADQTVGLGQDDYVLTYDHGTGLISLEASAGGGGSSPLTTKGDIYTYSTNDDRLAVGSNGQYLIADSAEATGLKWGDAADGLVKYDEVTSFTTGSNLFDVNINESFAVGRNNNLGTAAATTTDLAVFGNYCSVGNLYSSKGAMAFGYEVRASGLYAGIGGKNNRYETNYAGAGKDNDTTGQYSWAFGLNSTASGSYCFVFGNNLTNSESSSLLAHQLRTKGLGTTSSTSSLKAQDNGGSTTFEVQDDGVAVFNTFTVATLPSQVAGGLIYVSDETGGATMAFSDGTNWRRVQDRAVVA